MDAGQDPPEAPLPASPVGRLDSWKAVATHFGRDVRTVQRWERDEGLPVHRHVHHKHELDEWWRRRQRNAPDEADRELADRSGGGQRRIRAAVVTGVVLAGLALGSIAWRFRTEGADRARLDPVTHELIERGRHHLDQFTPDGARRAITAFSEAVARSPRSAEAHHYNMGLGYTRLGLHGRAIAEFERALVLVPDRVAYIAQLAAAHARNGDRNEALRLLRDLEARASREHVPAFQLAILHAALGHHDAAIDELERAEHEYEPALANLLVEPFWFTPIAHDSRFQELQGRVRQPVP